LRNGIEGSGCLLEAEIGDLNLGKNEALKNLLCPVCASPAFLPTTDTFDLGDILGRWEREAGVRFGQGTWEHYTHSASRRVTLYRCQNCEFAEFLPIVVGSHEFYINISSTDENYYLAEKWEFIQAIRDIKKFGGGKILDIGCGKGLFLDFLRESGLSLECAGYELNSEVAKIARSKGYTVFEDLSSEPLLSQMGAKKFDVICIFQVLEHLSDPVGLIKFLVPLVSPGGIFIIGVPDAGGPLRFFPNALTDIPPHHISRWCESVFRRGLTALGLGVLRIEFEPLPYYLWDSYLPVMLEREILPAKVARFMNKYGVTSLLIRVLRALRIKWLRGVRGHTLYAVLRREITGAQ